MRIKKSKTPRHNYVARHFGILDMSRLFMIMVRERNSMRDNKIPEFKKLVTYGDFATDYIKAMMATAIKYGEVKMYTGQKIVSEKFISKNDVVWDLKYGVTDLSIDMEHRYKHIDVKIDPSFRMKYLEKNKPKSYA